MRLTRYIPALIALAAAGSLSASSFLYATPTGAKDLGDGNPLSAEAIFSVSSVSGGTNNQLTITLENLEANPSEDGQILDALTFQLTDQTLLNSGAAISVTSSITEAIYLFDFHGNVYDFPAYGCNGSNTSHCSSDTANWSTTAVLAGSTATFDLCDAHISAIGCTNTELPAGEGIIGPQTGWYTKYGATQKLFNPYIYESITFVATIGPGGGSFNIPSAYANLKDVEFGFGEEGSDVTTEAGYAPEPSGRVLMTAALACGLAAYRYRAKFLRVG